MPGLPGGFIGYAHGYILTVSRFQRVSGIPFAKSWRATTQADLEDQPPANKNRNAAASGYISELRMKFRRISNRQARAATCCLVAFKI